MLRRIMQSKRFSTVSVVLLGIIALSSLPLVTTVLGGANVSPAFRLCYPSEGEWVDTFKAVLTNDPPRYDDGYRYDLGIDIAGEFGAAVYAIASGTIVERQTDGDQAVTIQHAERLDGHVVATRYLGMDVHNDIQLLQSVEAGQVIGYQNQTCAGCTAHVHLEIILDAQFGEPLDFWQVYYSRKAFDTNARLGRTTYWVDPADWVVIPGNHRATCNVPSSELIRRISPTPSRGNAPLVVATPVPGATRVASPTTLPTSVPVSTRTPIPPSDTALAPSNTAPPLIPTNTETPGASPIGGAFDSPTPLPPTNTALPVSGAAAKRETLNTPPPTDLGIPTIESAPIGGGDLETPPALSSPEATTVP